MTSLQDSASGLDRLPPDQRAVLQMVVARGQTFDEIARMLRIDRAAVRQRALSALDTLGPTTRLSSARRGLIADYLLGQLSDEEGAEVRDALARSARERAWARVVSSELAPLARGPLPEIPVEIELPEREAAPRKRASKRSRGRERSAAAPTSEKQAAAEEAAGASALSAEHERATAPSDLPQENGGGLAEELGAADEFSAGAGSLEDAETPEEGKSPSEYAFGTAPPPPRRVSRLGGAILLGAVAAVIIAVIVIFVIVGVGGGKAHRAPTRAAAAGTHTTARPLAQINLSSPSGGKAVGIAEVISADGATGVAIIGQGLQPNAHHDAYAIWLYNSPSSFYRLGYVQQAVGSNGRLSTAGRLPSNASSYKDLVVTLQNGPSNKPGKFVLEGALTGL